MSKSEEYYNNQKLESSQYGQGQENKIDVNKLETMNHKTLEDVGDKVNKHVEYQIGSTKLIAVKNLKRILKTLAI